MKKLSYIIIPLVTLLTSVLGSLITKEGRAWYQTINLPPITPPGSVIGSVWTVIFIFTAVAAIIVFNKTEKVNELWRLAILFLINAGLNVFWSYLFFGQYLIGWAVTAALVLEFSVLSLIVFCWPKSKLAAILLLPYAGWVLFASYLTYLIWRLNY